VKTRERYADADTTTLGASEWELLDAANGVLLILASSRFCGRSSCLQ
jgi:hypothetical protein